MVQLLKSIGFGVACTAILVAAAYGLATIITYLEGFGRVYALIPVLALVCIVCSTAHYFGNK